MVAGKVKRVKGEKFMDIDYDFEKKQKRLELFNTIKELYKFRKCTQEQIAQILNIRVETIRMATQKMGFSHGIRNEPYNPVVSAEELSFLDDYLK